VFHNGPFRLASEHLAVEHGTDEETAVGEKIDTGRQAICASIRFDGAVEGSRKYAPGVAIRKIEPPVAPARALGERKAVEKSGERRHDKTPQKGSIGHSFSEKCI
jgi:hypothetical protein